MAEVDLRLPVAPGRKGGQETSDITIALTTYPARICSVHLTIRSLLRQSVRAKRILLVLSDPEFHERSLPRRVADLEEEGLNILWIGEAMRSYQKLLPALRCYPEETVVTADDDILYPREWLSALYRAHLAHPYSIISARANELSLIDGKLVPYSLWPSATTSTPRNRLFPTGVGGTLYPPNSLDERVLDYELASRLCPTNDDIWFFAIALITGTPVEYVPDAIGPLRVRWFSQASALHHANVGEGENDLQLRQVLDYFHLWNRIQ